MLVHARASLLVFALAIAACATRDVPIAEPVVQEPGMQPLLLQTDPPGASCTIARGAVVVATVAATPAYVNVPLAKGAIEIDCRRGELEQRVTVAAVPILEVEREPVKPAPKTAASTAADAAGYALGTLSPVFAPAAAPVAAVIAITALMAADEQMGSPRPPPLLLAPAVFPTKTARDAHFAALKARLESETAAKHASIDASCHYFPCKAGEPACPHPICQQLHAKVSADLVAKLEQIPGLCARVRIVTP